MTFPVVIVGVQQTVKLGFKDLCDVQLNCPWRIMDPLAAASSTNPWSAELICKKRREQRVFFQFEIIINVLVSSFWFIWIPMLRVYGH